MEKSRRSVISREPLRSPSIRSPTSTAGGGKDLVGPSSSSRGSSPQYESKEPSDSSTLVGTCPDMCPAKERVQRERLRDLAVFERLNGHPRKTSPSLAVKKVTFLSKKRTLSSNEVCLSDIRPASVLQNTLQYLLSLVDTTGQPFEVVHDFVFDRTRSIRQDLSMQNIVNEQAIQMYEDMVRFHIISQQKLARHHRWAESSPLHHLNLEQLIKCLLSLYEIYEINRRTEFISRNETEFHSFYVLLHLGCKIPLMERSLSLRFRQLSSPILKSKELRFARTVIRYFRMGDYKRFFDVVAAEASQLQLCLIEPFLNEVRAQAISCINHSGYKLQPYPLKRLSEVLMIKEQELESLCCECGLEIITDELGCKLLPAGQSSFRQPKAELQSYPLSRPEYSPSKQC